MPYTSSIQSKEDGNVKIGSRRDDQSDLIHTIPATAPKKAAASCTIGSACRGMGGPPPRVSD